MGKCLSIIVPTYNMEQYLDCSLSSVELDDRDNYEVLIINDGSKDKSKQIAEKYQKRRPDIFKLIDKQNGNYGSCVNRGLQEATGRYVKILDADDAFLKDSFRAFLDFISAAEADLILSNAMTMSTDSKIVPESNSGFQFPEVPFKLSDIPESDVRRLEHFYITYKRKVFDGLNYRQTEGISYTDLEWDFYPMQNVSSVVFFKSPIYLYRMGRPGNTVSPENHCKNMWMERTVICGIIDKMVKQDTKVLCMGSFTDILLTKRVESVYYYHCVRYHSFLEEHDLIEFDTFIKVNAPALYKKLESCYITVAKLVHFKYIKEFRRRLSCRTWRYSMFNFYYYSVSFFKRMVH